MVPIMTREQMAENPLAVYAEPYNTLILDGRAFRNPVPDVPGLSPKRNMKAWVDRKLFIHNLGHAVLAYQANYHFPELVYTYEALEMPELQDKTRTAMLQSSYILEKMYPDEFDRRLLIDHTDELLMRFANKALGDTIFRVGCDLKRKLGRDDRLMVPILAGIKLNLPFQHIMEAWIKGCSFKAVGEDGLELEGDVQFKTLYGLDYRRILQEHCRLATSENPELYHSLAQITAKI
jgi:mannitol-1-phosphate 5-dehydrogenase